ncbi:T9SS type A sorting domain-containing protein [Seonamhaeicola sp. ML3]|uniref:T9SS type A sorting domain-containing protein n=1 Tax=Seonamhaeicola sp. ML3 TaxID=2937786 RepID=UPI00200C49F6|nr:T9SS type A sorting domain-containing protein [Seonamhaeicola sp. ML3]
MKKKLLLAGSLVFCAVIALITILYSSDESNKVVKIERKTINPTQKGKKKTLEERALYNEARDLYEFYRQVNPNTGIVSKTDKSREFKQARSTKLRTYNSLSAKVPQATYISRGPSNFGGRTRALVVDRSDNTGNTIIAGGVSGGVFRTTDGGATWTKVSSNDEIHNVTSIVQDPRAGQENTWYYGTGEGLGNSTSKSGAFYLGQGIWKSTDGGITWSQLPSTSSTQTSFDSFFDIVYRLAVHPTTGDLYAALLGRIRRFNGSSWITEIDNGSSGASTNQATDIVITTGGRVYVSFSGVDDASVEGVWTSATGIEATGAWSRINAADFTPAGRVVMAIAPSNEDILYVLFDNGTTSDCSGTEAVEAGLWQWNQSTTTFTDYTSKLPDESGCSDGNDPFAIQGGYDLVVSVKPDDEDFVIIGGTNAYKIADITTDATFTRIGGYASSAGYSLYLNHHPDIHSLVFSPFNDNILFTGTDGGVHRTNNITDATVAWTSLNNGYQTFQFYHININPDISSNFVIGGSQDNGTTVGGTPLNGTLTAHSAATGGDGGAAALFNDAGCSLGFFSSVQNGQLYRYCDGYTEITPRITAPEIGPPAVEEVLYPSQFVTYYHSDPDNNNALYYASNDKLLRTTDALNVTQDTWTDLGSTSTFTHTDNFQIFSTTRGTYSAATSYLLMGGDTGHIYRLDDPQNAASIASAIDITPPTASTTFPSIVTGLAIHPTNRDIVLATYSNYGINSIYLTTNATSATPTWTLVERNLSLHSIRSAAITEVSGEVLYFVGTARGLYSSTDPTTTDWVREGSSTIGFAVVSSLAYRPADSKLLVGTHGNGMFEATITDVLSIEDVNNISNEISLYPNPVTTRLNLKTSFYSKTFDYNIINVSGQIISRGVATPDDGIDVSALSKGVYFLNLKFEDKTGTKKFIKN